MRKIVHVVDSLNQGGAERVAVDLANGLSNLGYTIYFCATRHDGPLRTALSENIALTILGRTESYHGLLKFRRFVTQNQIEIVHAHGNTTALFCLISLWGARNVKIVHHDHNPLLSQRNVFINRLLLTRVHAWIAVSNEILKWVIQVVRYHKAMLLINPIQVERFCWLSKDERPIKKVVLLANYRPQKDLDTLISCVFLLRGKNVKFKVYCYGAHSTGSYYQLIANRVKELNLQDVIELNSSVNDTPAVLGSADIGMLSSASEGLPISLLEYMAASLPVIVTDVGECKRIVTQANCGAVVPPGDPAALSTALEYVLRNERKWSEWGRNGRDYIEKNHALNIQLRKVQEVYAKL